MTNISTRKIAACLVLLTFWVGNIWTCTAQTFSSGVAPDPDVLIAKPPSLNTGHNLETSLVDIKAVDAPALHTQGDKTGIGSEERYGQGVIIDASGIIATNRHVIGEAQHIFVMLAGHEIFEASLLRNSATDLCLIKINAPFALKAISMADPAEIQIGQKVIAIANAGFNPQRIKSGEIIKVFKQLSTDAIALMEMNIALKPGDSGGPILNQEGSLLGLIMGKQISDPSKSYAIPASQIQQVYFLYRNSILS